jgi:Holliday junction resolvase RusA-like endonuclease
MELTTTENMLITIDIDPMAKPRMTRSDKWNQRDCVMRYWQFKDRLEALFGDRELPETFHVVFTVPMPASWSEKRKVMFDGKPHQVRPDTSNYLKAFEDCLMEEDSSLWDIRSTKIWGRKGSIQVRILEPFTQLCKV